MSYENALDLVLKLLAAYAIFCWILYMVFLWEIYNSWKEFKEKLESDNE